MNSRLTLTPSFTSKVIIPYSTSNTLVDLGQRNSVTKSAYKIINPQLEKLEDNGDANLVMLEGTKDSLGRDVLNLTIIEKDKDKFYINTKSADLDNFLNLKAVYNRAKYDLDNNCLSVQDYEQNNPFIEYFI